MLMAYSCPPSLDNYLQLTEPPCLGNCSHHLTPDGLKPMTKLHRDMKAWLTSLRWAEGSNSLVWIMLPLWVRPTLRLTWEQLAQLFPLLPLASQPTDFSQRAFTQYCKSHALNTGLGMAFRELSLSWLVTVNFSRNRILVWGSGIGSLADLKAMRFLWLVMGGVLLELSK